MQYILRRWTKEARTEIVQDVAGRKVQEDVNLDSTRRCKQLCPKLIRLATQVADRMEAYVFIDKAVDKLSKQAREICKKQINLNKDSAHTTESVPNIDEFMVHQNPNEVLSRKAKGFKKLDGKMSRKRPKSWVEKQTKRRRKAPTTNDLQNQAYEVCEFVI